MVDALVAGHICLDIIPGFESRVTFDPGRLIEVGAAQLSTGGVVSNTGQSLHRLGVITGLCGKIGDDLFGKAVCEVLERTGSGLSAGMAVSDQDSTSYSVVISLTGEDRMFLHYPGCNDTFTSADVSDDRIRRTRLMHFGYPTLMAKMHEDGGRELVSLFKRAKDLGVTTSLDMSLPDLSGAAAQANWYQILEQVLPYTDLFLPNAEELFFMLEREGFLDHGRQPIPKMKIEELTERALTMGAQVVGVKAGTQGLYLAARSEFGDIGHALPINASEWRGCRVWTPCFAVDVAGTTGAGDATVAGLLMGWLHSFCPEDAARAAVAVGACSCEGHDAISGIRSWAETEERIQKGWPTLTVTA